MNSIENQQPNILFNLHFLSKRCILWQAKNCSFLPDVVTRFIIKCRKKFFSAWLVNSLSCFLQDFFSFNYIIGHSFPPTIPPLTPPPPPPPPPPQNPEAPPLQISSQLLFWLQVVLVATRWLKLSVVGLPIMKNDVQIKLKKQATIELWTHI